MSSTLNATSLAVAVAHAVTYLTRPLATRLAPSSLTALQTALEANLAAAFAPTWFSHEPTRGSGRRALSFAPGALPPRPIYKACAATGVDWAQWSALLSDKEFDLVVDPGCVSLRLTNAWGAPTCIAVWSADLEFAQATRGRGLHTPQPIAPQASKTLAQRLIEDDAADEEALFSLLAAEMREPAWKSPVAEAFPSASFGSLVVPPAVNPAASFFSHSRSSSRSSVSTSSSFVSDDAMSSCGSLSSVSTTASSCGFSDTSSTPSKKSGHGRSQSTRVFIDTSRKEVTPYDGGKTTVLTGGVMLGAPASRKSNASSRKVPRF